MARGVGSTDVAELIVTSLDAAEVLGVARTAGTSLGSDGKLTGTVAACPAAPDTALFVRPRLRLR